MSNCAIQLVNLYILFTSTFHNHYDHHDNPEGQEDHLECYVIHLVEVEVETEGPSLGGTEGREGDAETVPGHRVHQNSDKLTIRNINPFNLITIIDTLAGNKAVEILLLLLSRLQLSWCVERVVGQPEN